VNGPSLHLRFTEKGPRVLKGKSNVYVPLKQGTKSTKVAIDDRVYRNRLREIRKGLATLQESTSVCYFFDENL